MPPSEQEKERLSAIIQELNDRFGAGLTEKDRISLEHLDFQLYKRIADDRAFGKALLDFLFEGFWRGRESGESE